jgi:hypothetical protein
MIRKESPMLSFDALVRGRVKYDGEQGPGSRVPPGRCTVQAHEGVVSLTWSEEGLERSATLSAQQFEEYLEGGAILIVDSAQLAHRRTPARSERSW